jgi:hypothetical protein
VFSDCQYRSAAEREGDTELADRIAFQVSTAVTLVYISHLKIFLQKIFLIKAFLLNTSLVFWATSQNISTFTAFCMEVHSERHAPALYPLGKGSEHVYLHVTAAQHGIVNVTLRRFIPWEREVSMCTVKLLRHNTE